jgi:hypothetical protein
MNDKNDAEQYRLLQAQQLIEAFLKNEGRDQSVADLERRINRKDPKRKRT